MDPGGRAGAARRHRRLFHREHRGAAGGPGGGARPLRRPVPGGGGPAHRAGPLRPVPGARDGLCALLRVLDGPAAGLA
ncbi:hypothetical protein B5G43_16420 [Flavonifractor sp. An92]|nr:hypothetical protein B5G43_16420 [Flavonifractor sp. An92]